MLECPICKTKMVWENDYSQENGFTALEYVVSVHHCTNAECGVEVQIHFKEDEEE